MKFVILNADVIVFKHICDFTKNCKHIVWIRYINIIHIVYIA